MKPVRFLPLVALAAFSLLSLKLAGLMLGEGYMITGSQKTLAKAIPDANPPAKPTSKKAKTGSKSSSGPSPAKGQKKKSPPKDVLSLRQGGYQSSSEIKLLSSLSKRRKQLDRREKEIELRLHLIKAAEKRIDQRIEILKGLESKIQRFSTLQKKQKKQQFNRLVKMYSSMKPTGAARIFNELDKQVLLGIIENMKPAAMSAILAAMSPAKAREMTISLAGMTKKSVTEESLDDLPKISGK